jgi:hypothetical protein
MSRGKLVNPDSLGLSVKLEELLERQKEFETYYSGPGHNPSALVFVPEQGPFRWELPLARNKWKRIENEKDLLEVARRLKGRGMGTQVKLLVVVPPTDVSGQEGSLPLIYTFGYSAPKPVRGEENAFTLRQVDEKPPDDMR